jgi:hypothetical protein
LEGVGHVSNVDFLLISHFLWLAFWFAMKSRPTIALHDVQVLNPGQSYVDPLYALAEQIRVKKEEIERSTAELKSLESKMKARKSANANVTYSTVCFPFFKFRSS